MSTLLEEDQLNYSKIDIISTEGKEHIAVLTGGVSREREVCLASSDSVCKSLVNLGYKVTQIDIGDDLPDVLNRIKPDKIFNSLHGTLGEDGRISGLLDVMKIPYTHSGVLASAIAFDKLKTRQVATYLGVRMAEAIVISKNMNLTSDPMPRPYVIKPISEGSSVGVSIIMPEDDFNISEYDWLGYDQVIVEKYIAGREIQVAVIDGKAIGTIELIPEGKFYDFEAKYTEGKCTHICPAPLSKEDEAKILEISEIINNEIGCKSMSRVDFRFNDIEGGDKEFYFLEINTHPGFTPLSLVPEIAASKGYKFDDLVEILLKSASWQK